MVTNTGEHLKLTRPVKKIMIAAMTTAVSIAKDAEHVVPLYVSTADGERGALIAKKVAKVVPLYATTADRERGAFIAEKVAKVVPLYVSTAD